MRSASKTPNPLPLVALLAALVVILGLMFFRLQSMGYFNPGGNLPDDGPAPAFELTDQKNRVLRREDLTGRVWVANFIFTRCAGPCPLMSLRAQELVSRVPDFKMVSFTSDPDYDTPEVLARYEEKFKADPGRWFFLTGSKRDIARIASEFKFGTIEQPDMHSTRFVLIDAQGRIRGYYDSNDPEHLARLERGIRSL